MINLTKYGKATCPTCKGEGKMRRVSASGIAGRLQPCLACRATGVVEAYRVCGTCLEWRDSCACESEDRGMRVFKRQPVTVIDAKAEVVHEIAIPVTDQIAPPAPRRSRKKGGGELKQPACPGRFGKRCEIKHSEFLTAWFCSLCGHYEG